MLKQIRRTPMNNKGQIMGVLLAIGVGIVGLAIVIMTGLVVTSEFGDAIGTQEVNDTSDFIQAELGENGLAGWIPAVVAISVGLLFLGFFVGRRFLGGRGA